MDKRRILLVEDEAVTAMYLRSNLVKFGYEVPAVLSRGEDAIRFAAECRPDLVLMDITLEGPMSGIAAAEEIHRAQAIPVVYLTAHADAETIRRATKTEPYGYLPKPCTPEALMSALEVAFCRGEAEARHREAEAAMIESENKFRALADSTADWEYWIGAEGQVVYVSPSCEGITGHGAAAFTQDPALFRRIVHPDDLEAYDEHVRRAKERPDSGALEFRIVRPDGSTRWIGHICQPVRDAQGRFVGQRGSNRDVTERKTAEQERERLIGELQASLAKVKLFSGLIPICASCKKIRDDQGYWRQLEAYIRDHSEAEFSHGICPDCAQKLCEEASLEME